MLAALAALPLVQKAEQSLVKGVGAAVSAFFAPAGEATSGQKAPQRSANSAQPSASTPLAASANAPLANLPPSQSQGSAHAFRHGLGVYRAASALAAAQSGAGGGAGATPSLTV